MNLSSVYRRSPVKGPSFDPDSRSEAAAATEERAAYDFEAVGYALSFHYVLRELGVGRVVEPNQLTSEMEQNPTLIRFSA